MGERGGRVARVFVERFTPPRTTLADEELHHLRRVLRLRDGATVEVFAADGSEATGVLDGDTVEHGPVKRRERDVTVSVASAVPKGERADWLVEKLAELGVAEWRPLLTEHSTVDPRPAKLAKLRRRAIEAAKQARTPGVMAVGEPWPVERLLERGGSMSVLSTAEAEAPRVGVGEAHTIVVGPEGGWSVSEMERFAACGVRAVTLGPTVLRVETAAVVGAGVIGALMRGGESSLRSPLNGS
ncbi:MAG: RsmE family RNA methyltransferase [Planctomycetota bacterium]